MDTQTQPTPTLSEQWRIQEKAIRGTYCAACFGRFDHGDRLVVVKVNGSLALMHGRCL